MTPMLATVSAGQWVIIALAGLVALAGFALMILNLLPLLVPRRPGTPPQPLIGPPKPIPRRTFFGRVILAGFGAAVTNFGAVSLAFLWPNLAGGFGGRVTLPTPLPEILAQIKQTRLPFYFAPGRFYLVLYDDTNPQGTRYVGEGVAAQGIMALYQRCPHLGCRVPFCGTSQWFECPCHGSKYNAAGEYRLGPAPRGMDRFPVEVANGIVSVDTSVIVTGPPRGTNTTGQEPQGPFCVEQVQAEEE